VRESIGVVVVPDADSSPTAGPINTPSQRPSTFAESSFGSTGDNASQPFIAAFATALRRHQDTTRAVGAKVIT
jgi:hypothetical protein